MRDEKNTIEMAIANLEKTSAALEAAADGSECYSTLYAHYLDVISYESRRLANDLKVCREKYGVV